MRCLTLAGSLNRNGASVVFICRDLPGNIYDEVIKQKFKLCLLDGKGSGGDYNPEDDAGATTGIIGNAGDVEWLIVDHYAIGGAWENQLRGSVKRIMAIDDLADRSHNCNILLDQNLFDNPEERYGDLLPPGSVNLLGPRYALLRPEFTVAREGLHSLTGTIRRILISMGGADPHNVTVRALLAIKALDNPDITVDVAVGGANKHMDEIREISQDIDGCNIHHPADEMAGLMAAADLCLGAGGSTTWERCCLGLPTLFIAGSDYEIEIARSADAAGIGKYLGKYNEVLPETIAREAESLFVDPGLIRLWSSNAAALVDGRGTERVCRAIMEYSPAEVRK
jgi:UDP-2,4-diacetamido-2,4,6-trideoxy-beta-L-altropyranose hydrolase